MFIWWKGNGLLVGLIVALVIVSAQNTLGTNFGGAIACMLCAVMIFAFRGSIGEESSLYSIPVRIWPPILFLLSLLIIAGK